MAHLRTVILVLTVVLAGCAEQRFYVAAYADSIVHRSNPKVLIFSGDANGAIVNVRWGRLCDVADCAMPGPPAGIFPHYPPECYARYHKECDGKKCRSAWWDRCAASLKQKEGESK